MVISLKKHFATERHDLEWCVKELPSRKEHVRLIIERIKAVKPQLKPGAKILEIGAAQGISLIALKDLGYFSTGIEPWDHALKVAEQLSKITNRKIDIKKAAAEKLPFPDEHFDVVIADSVMEHVKDADLVMKEVFRVLKKGGGFYIYTASAMCPIQGEIRFFPFFSWYPQKAKEKIMNWAVENKPSLVGYTRAPAINWFTRKKGEKMLKKAGFNKVYDTWDVLREEEIGNKSIILKIIKLNKLTKLIGDILLPGYLCVAVK